MLTNNLGYLVTSYAVLCADCNSDVMTLLLLWPIFLQFSLSEKSTPLLIWPPLAIILHMAILTAFVK